MKNAFYETFERHAHGEGLKAHSTHYCPGCGHGVVHRDIADLVKELGAQDRTIFISPVGCSVFAYYYFDTGNSQAAHGRAPVVGLGHKLAAPDSLVVCYQGDLASIGLAETISVAQQGLPLTVIFINNAIYGMTGGQLAPTSLTGQRTATSPDGRNRLMGEPLKMAELIAQLDGPIYVERVALYDAKNRVKTRKAIKKALQLQLEGRGYSFIEVLSECPTHLKLTPVEAEKWVQENMEPVFPLGVKKDLSATTEPWFKGPRPSYEPEAVLGLSGAEPAVTGRAATPWPATAAKRDLAFKFAGSGGDGAQTAALLLVRAAIELGYDATHIPAYGPESRGGTSYADVHVAADEVLNPAAPEPDVLVAFNAPSLAKFGPHVVPGGTILYDSTVIPTPPTGLEGRHVLGIPFTRIAADLGKPMVKNVVALGALQAATHLLPDDALIETLAHVLKDKASVLPLNRAAYAAGLAAVQPAPSA